jgi:hypothetical protein
MDKSNPIARVRPPSPPDDLPQELAIPISDYAHRGELTTIPDSLLIRKFRARRPVRILRHYAGGRTQEDVEACKVLVKFLLDELEIELPEGVLALPKKKRGRPHGPAGMEIVLKWMQIGMPSRGSSALAKACYGSKFTTAPPAERKKMVDLCRAAIDRAHPPKTTKSRNQS